MKLSRLVTWTVLGLSVLAVAALGVWRYSVHARSYYTDADRIRVPLAQAPIRRILWQPALPVPGATDADTYEPRVSADGNLLVFVRGRAGANADLYQRRRTATGWSDPEPIPGINSSVDDLGPELSPDGSALYFYSDRDGGEGGYDLWVSKATDTGWSPPVNLGPSVNTSHNEYGPALTPDGKRLYFSSNRPRAGEPAAQRDAWPATIREQRSRHDYDLYQYDLGQAEPATSVPEINTAADEGAPAISPAGDFLYFASDRAGGLGGFDIYRSRVLRGELLAPEPLGAAVNSASNDLDPALSTDGFRIFFSSDRTDSADAKDARYALWVSGSREVFTEIEPARAGMFADLWRNVWPWLLALLTAVLLAAILFLTMRDAAMRRRLAQLSLMAKCLLVSLFIHALILSLLAAWRVGNAIGDILHAPGGTKVVLGSVGSGGLASQVRAAVASVALQTPKLETERPGIDSEVSPAPVARLSVAPAPVQVTTAGSTITPEDARTESAALPVTSSPELFTPEVRSARAPAPEAPDAPAAEPLRQIAGAMPEPERAAVPVNELTSPGAVHNSPAASPVNLSDSTPAAVAPSESAPGASPVRPAPATSPAATTAEARAPRPDAPSGPTAESTVNPGSGAATSVADRAALGLRPSVGASSVSLTPPTAAPGEGGAASAIAPSESSASSSVALNRAETPGPVSAASPARLPATLAPGAEGRSTEVSLAPGSGAATSVADRAALGLRPSIGASSVSVAPPTATPGEAGAASAIAPSESSASSTVALNHPESMGPASAASSARLPAAPSPGAEGRSNETALAPGSGAATSVSDRPALGMRTAVRSAPVALNPASAGPSDTGPASAIPPSEAAAPASVARSRSTPAAQVAAGPSARIPQIAESSAGGAAPESGLAPGAGAATSVSTRAALGAQPSVGGGAVSLAPAPAAATDTGSPSGITPSDSSAPASIATSRPARSTGIGSVPGPRIPEATDRRAPAGAEIAGTVGGSTPLPGRSRAAAVTAQGEPGSAPTVHLAPGSGGPPAVAPGISIAPSDAPTQGVGKSPTPRSGLALSPSTSVGVRLPSVPAAPQPPTENFAQRAPEVRGDVLERMGGSQETEQAVGLALEWFTRHQAADGHWSGKHFDDHCGSCAGAAQIDFDAATTGMTLLCFLSAGHTHTKDGPHRDRVHKALRWLVERQDGAGDLRGPETMYSQTIGAVALCEAYAMTKDPWLEGPARRAVSFVVRGAGERGNSRDTSVLGWQIMAVKSAQRCGFDISGASFESAERWLDRCAPRQTPGRYGYSPTDRPGAAATAEAMFVRQLVGHSREEPRMRDSAAFILASPPQWRKGAPTYYWYYATLALFQQQGDEWKRWNDAVVRELLANQAHEGPAAGSWEPTDEWSQLGGRIYQTAVCTLSLEVYYRYAPGR